MSEAKIEINEADDDSDGPTPLWLLGACVICAGLALYLGFGDLWQQLEDQSGSRRGGLIRLLMSIGKGPLTGVLGLAAALFGIGALVSWRKSRTQAA